MNMSLPITDKNIVHPLIYNDVAYSDYGVHKITGHVHSRKLGKEWIQLSGHGKKYPSVSISNNGIISSILVHRAAACTILGYPKIYPDTIEIPREIWKNANVIMKKNALKNLEVNHIDGNTRNHSPSNLEWVTKDQNIKHYQKSRKKAA